jgi:hypothetical protein
MRRSGDLLLVEVNAALTWRKASSSTAAQALAGTEVVDSGTGANHLTG